MTQGQPVLREVWEDRFTGFVDKGLNSFQPNDDKRPRKPLSRSNSTALQLIPAYCSQDRLE